MITLLWILVGVGLLVTWQFTQNALFLWAGIAVLGITALSLLFLFLIAAFAVVAAFLSR